MNVLSTKMAAFQGTAAPAGSGHDLSFKSFAVSLDGKPDNLHVSNIKLSDVIRGDVTSLMTSLQTLPL